MWPYEFSRRDNYLFLSIRTRLINTDKADTHTCKDLIVACRSIEPSICSCGRTCTYRHALGLAPGLFVGPSSGITDRCTIEVGAEEKAVLSLSETGLESTYNLINLLS